MYGDDGFTIEPTKKVRWKLQENGDQYVHGWGFNMPLENSKDQHKNQDPGLAR